LFSERHFRKLVRHNPTYKIFEIIGNDENGELYFRCLAQSEDNLCLIHKERPDICRGYPHRTLKLHGGKLDDNCGYKLIPAISFKEILKQISK